MRNYPYHPMSPDFLPASFRGSGEIHIDTPVIRIPSDLPVEMQAAQQFHAHVEPKTGIADPDRFSIPPTLFDQCASTGNMVHSLQSPFRHDFVDVEDDGSCRDYNGISVRILHLFKEQVARCLIELSRRSILIGGIDQVQVSSATRKKGVQKHRLTKRVERQKARKLEGSVLS